MTFLKNQTRMFANLIGVELDDLACRLCKLDFRRDLFYRLSQELESRASAMISLRFGDDWKLGDQILGLFELPSLYENEDRGPLQVRITRDCLGCQDSFCSQHGSGLFCVFCRPLEDYYWNLSVTVFDHPSDNSAEIASNVLTGYEDLKLSRDHKMLFEMISEEAKHWLGHPGRGSGSPYDTKGLPSLRSGTIPSSGSFVITPGGLPSGQIEAAEDKLRSSLVVAGVRAEVVDKVISGEVLEEDARSSVESYYRVEGDVVGHKVENIGQKVEVHDSVVMGNVGGDSEELMQCCPFCGKDFRFGRNPRFCPYCKEDLSQ